MKESYREYLASNSGLEPYAGDGDIAGVASAGGNAGQPLSSEIITSVCRSCPDLEKATSSLPILAMVSMDAAESVTLCMRRHSKRGFFAQRVQKGNKGSTVSWLADWLQNTRWFA